MSAARTGLSWQGPAFAREAEAAGISAFCAGDFVDHEAYVTFADMVRGTRDALVGPAIAYAFARSPFTHAAAVRQLARSAGERIFLGLGTGAFSVNRDWFGVDASRPAARMAELVQATKAFLEAENGDLVRFEGEFYRIAADIGAPVLGRLDVPVLVGAFNRIMARTSGRVADGVIGHGLFTTRWWDEVIRPAAAEGRAASGRGGRALEFGWVITAVDDEDPRRAEADARRMIAFYLTVATYDPFVELHGWQAPVAAIRDAFAARDPDAMARAVTAEMLDEIAVFGSTAEAVERLGARGDGIARDVRFLAPPSYLVSERRRRAYARSSLALLGG